MITLLVVFVCRSSRFWPLTSRLPNQGTSRKWRGCDNNLKRLLRIARYSRAHTAPSRQRARHPSRAWRVRWQPCTLNSRSSRRKNKPPVKQREELYEKGLGLGVGIRHEQSRCRASGCEPANGGRRSRKAEAGTSQPVCGYERRDFESQIMRATSFVPSTNRSSAQLGKGMTPWCPCRKNPTRACTTKRRLGRNSGSDLRNPTKMKLQNFAKRTPPFPRPSQPKLRGSGGPDGRAQHDTSLDDARK